MENALYTPANWDRKIALPVERLVEQYMGKNGAVAQVPPLGGSGSDISDDKRFHGTCITGAIAYLPEPLVVLASDGRTSMGNGLTYCDESDKQYGLGRARMLGAGDVGIMFQQVDFLRNYEREIYNNRNGLVDEPRQALPDVVELSDALVWLNRRIPREIAYSTGFILGGISQDGEPLLGIVDGDYYNLSQDVAVDGSGMVAGKGAISTVKMPRDPEKRSLEDALYVVHKVLNAATSTIQSCGGERKYSIIYADRWEDKDTEEVEKMAAKREGN